MTAEEKLERLRQGINTYLDGDAGFKVDVSFKENRLPHKYDRCIHSRYRWEGCEECTDNYLEELLRESA